MILEKTTKCSKNNTQEAIYIFCHVTNACDKKPQEQEMASQNDPHGNVQRSVHANLFIKKKKKSDISTCLEHCMVSSDS